MTVVGECAWRQIRDKNIDSQASSDLFLGNKEQFS